MIATYLECPEFALSLISTGTLVRLDKLGIPFPIRAPYTPYGVVNVAGNKLAVGDGFPSCQWEYPDAGLTREVWMRYNAFLNNAASAFVYLRTLTYGEDFSNFLGVMRLPSLVPVGYNVKAWQPLTVSFTGLVPQ